MSKSKATDRRASTSMNSDEVIEILDDFTDSNDSSAAQATTRETRSRTVKALAKINQLRKEGGVYNFNPDKSLRERKKITKAVQSTQRKKNSALYSPAGILLETGQDLCDCTEEECPGCFYQCPRCNGSKCGGTCRRRRYWLYEYVTIDGQSMSNVQTSLADLLEELG